MNIALQTEKMGDLERVSWRRLAAARGFRNVGNEVTVTGFYVEIRSH